MQRPDERKRNEAALTSAFEELAKSEAELRTIIDAIPQLIVSLRADGTFLSANQAVLEFTGLTKEEVLACLGEALRTQTRLPSRRSRRFGASEGWLGGRESHDLFFARLRAFAIFCQVFQILRFATAVLSSTFFRLPTVADFAGVMSLKMSLAASVSSDPLVEAQVKVLC